MLKANPSGGASAPYLPAQFGGVIELVLVWPFHGDLQVLKQVGICALREKGCGGPSSFKLNASFSRKGTFIL